MVYFHKTNGFIKRAFPSLEWSVRTPQKEIFLTFDDGPIPYLTDFVLETLSKFNAKATFFLVGNNIEKHTSIGERILAQGHLIGNHTHNHLNGWKTHDEEYFDNVALGQEHIDLLYKLSGVTPPLKPLFRPPYGKLTQTQRNLLKQHYRIIMWDVLTGDFDRSLAPVNCLKRSLELTSNGSIVTFHDNVKARLNLEFVLPRFLEHFAEKNFDFKPLNKATEF